MKKVCSKCKTERDIIDFPISKQKKCGYNTICKPCGRLYGKKRYDRSHEYFRKILQDYGVTKEHYEKMKTDQNGCCAICKQDKPPLCLDHCHTTGKVRGLLCRNCNGVLGRFADDAERFQCAVQYLKKET